MKLELKEKAYVINNSNLSEPWFSDPEPSYGTRGKAKLEILGRHDGHNLDGGEEIDFLNIKIRRSKEDDKYLFDGNIVSLSEIKGIKDKIKRKKYLKRLISDKKTTHCYIRKGSYYRPNSCGYTDMRHRAGVYTIEEGVSHATSCRDLDLVVIDIEEHNKMMQKEIEELSSRLIIINDINTL